MNFSRLAAAFDNTPPGRQIRSGMTRKALQKTAGPFLRELESSLFKQIRDADGQQAVMLGNLLHAGAVEQTEVVAHLDEV